MSPFEIFRRNLKPLMVFLTALSLFAFVVLPAMDGYLRSAQPGQVDAQVANFNGVPLSESRISHFTRQHQTTVRFLRELAEETIRRGGAPRTPGFVYDTRSKQVRALGINESPGRLASVRTLQFESEAEKEGFDLDESALKSWLQQFTDDTMTDREIIGMLAKSSRNSMGEFHLHDQLRSQLLASLYQRGAGAGVVTEQQMPLTTPTQQWTNFLKLNQKATVDAYGLIVQDFYDKTDENPAVALVSETYEEGKERYPNSESPAPAFRRRETATFEYLSADLKEFVDREVAKLSDDEIRAEYDKRIKGGQFQLPETSASEMLDAVEAENATDAPADAEESTAETAKDMKPEEDKPAEKKKPAEEKRLGPWRMTPRQPTKQAP